MPASRHRRMMSTWGSRVFWRLLYDDRISESKDSTPLNRAKPTGLGAQRQILGFVEEVLGDQGRPAPDPARAVELPEHLDAIEKVPPVVAEEIVVDEDDMLVADRLDLVPDIVEVVGPILPPFRRQRTEAAVEVAVAARFDVAGNAAAIEQVEAWDHLGGHVGRAEHLAGDRLKLFDVAIAGVVEEPPGAARQCAHRRPAGDHDDLRVQGPRVGRQVQHAVERRGQAGQHQHVGPAEQRRVAERAAILLAVDAHVAQDGKRARQEHRAHGARHPVGVPPVRRYSSKNALTTRTRLRTAGPVCRRAGDGVGSWVISRS